jgi:DnaJ-class molecular chaperone
MFPASLTVKNPCGNCKGSGHLISESRIVELYDPLYNLPAYKMELRVDHCPACKGTGEVQVENVIAPVYIKRSLP